MNTNTRNKLYPIIGGACLAAICLLNGPAKAADPDVPTKAVKFQDLDISKPAGAKVLYRRIRAAAKEVCPETRDNEFWIIAARNACIDRAIDDAVKQVDSPLLTSLRFGSPARLASK